MIDFDTKQPFYRQRLREAMKDRRVTNEAIAEKIGAHPVTVSKLLNGRMRMDEEWRAKFSAGLDLAPEILFSDAPAPPPPAAKPLEVRPAELAVPGMSAMPLDLPVMGTAAGSLLRGAFQFEGGVIDYVRRPPALVGAKDAYALYVEGDSMLPLYPHGELIIVHPGRPPRLNDGVVVQSRSRADGDIEATLGILAARTGSEIKLQKLNPSAVVSIKREYVDQVHKVLTLSELFGV